MTSIDGGRGRRRWLVAFAVMIGLVVGGAGCATDEGDDPAPTSSPSPTTDAPTEPATDEPTTVPTPWPEPSPPPEMEGDDIEGAKAAAVYFIELYTFVYVTGQLEQWELISHPECQFCAGVADRVNDVHADGGYADGPVIEVVSIEAEAPDGDFAFYSVWMDVTESRSSRFNQAGAVIDTTDGGPSGFDVALLRTTDGWQVRGAVVQEPSEEGDAQ
ncbi:DUF6318 family protein [Georgenia sp. MJ170]|uniref:DUF6318 family protein n=1 Tax=Georgenia sunbinii TaxID=3117728 RepID=UPI002F26A9E1